KTFVNPAIATDQVMFCIVWIDPDVVVIDVFRLLTESAQRSTTIIGDHQENIHHVNSIYVFWVRDDTSVIHRGRVEFIPTLPTTAAIRGTKDSTFPTRSFDGDIDNVWIHWRDRQPDATQFNRW